MNFGPIVDVDWLRHELGQADLRLVDCRWKLGEPGAGRNAYAAGHIPGAAFLDLDSDLSDPPGPRGRHPLPDAERFERTARAAGVSNGSRVVAYDEAGEGGAARLWWLLRHFGHEAVAALDGGQITKTVQTGFSIVTAQNMNGDQKDALYKSSC